MTVQTKIAFIGLLILGQKLQAQEHSLPSIFSEIHLSGIQTLPSTSNEEGRFGFGAGVQKVWRNDAIFQLTTGLHYSYSSLFIHQEFSPNHFGNTRIDFTKEFHSIHIPIGARFQAGKTINYFLEPSIQTFIPLNKSELNWGPQVGLGAKFNINDQTFMVKAAYFYGLRNQGSEWTNITYSNASLTVGIGLK